LGKIIRNDSLRRSGEFRSALEASLSDADYQLQQYAAYILTEYVYLFQGVKVSDWPDAVFSNMVAGLYDDCMNVCKTFWNASEFTDVLYALEEHRAEKELFQALDSEDSQARFCAAVILSKYLRDSVQPEISAELLRNMIDDRHKPEIAAYRALILLGRENLENLLKTIESEDWQQAALLQCAACHFGVDWTAQDRYLERWTKEALRPYLPSKICMAALYLHPKTKSFLKNRQKPELLERMWRLSVNLRDPQKKERWASTWIWFLQTDEKIDVYHRDPWFAPWVFEAGH